MHETGGIMKYILKDGSKHNQHLVVIAILAVTFTLFTAFILWLVLVHATTEKPKSAYQISKELGQ